MDRTANWSKAKRTLGWEPNITINDGLRTTYKWIENKYDMIVNSINLNGFKNTANLYGITDSAKFGGNIGWVKKTQLSGFIIDELKKIKVGEFTKPIQTSHGFVILKINEKRLVKKNIDFDQELKKLISIEKNRQLNQFSLIYFNRIKQGVFISEQ